MKDIKTQAVEKRLQKEQESQCQQMTDEWYKRYPEMKDWQERLKRGFYLLQGKGVEE